MPEEQHQNIRTLIRLYQEDTIDGSERICVNQGEVVSFDEIFNRRSASFIEGSVAYELAEKFAYGRTVWPRGIMR